jgi:hypothetical protein
LQAIIKRLKREKRGISTVIVVMLSLVLVVIIVGNVVLWSYQMNQFDWERLHEDVTITDVSRVNGSSWSVAQSEYALNIGSRISGAYTDTQAIDDQFESFREGLNWWSTDYDYRRQITIVNNAASTLNAGYSICVTMDTASLILAGKVLASGDDLRVIYWSGSTWSELDRDTIDVNSASTQVWFKTQAAIEANGVDSNYYVYYGNPSSGSPPANKSNVYLWFDDFNRANNPGITTETAYSVKTGGGTWAIEQDALKNVGASGDPNKLIITALGDVSTAVDMLVKIRVTSFTGGDLSRIGLSCCMDTSTSRGSGYCSMFHDNSNSIDLLNDLRSWGTQGTYSWSLDTWYYMRFRVVDPASGIGQVKVWQVGTNEPSTWTVDGSFGSGTARSYGEVGFAGSRTTDTTYFDDILIRFIADSEPSTSLGSEESQGSNRLDIGGTFVIDLSTYPLTSITNVEIQMRYRPSDTGEKWYLKAYNWTSSTYSDSGFNSTAGHTPTTGWNYYAVNFTNCWESYVNSNGTVYVKIVDEGADADQTTLDIDFLAIRVILDGTMVTFENQGSSTSHLVSLWVINSTLHQRYDINVFINSGDVTSSFRSDISLPDKPFMIKVVTERGNVAVFSED